MVLMALALTSPHFQSPTREIPAFRAYSEPNPDGISIPDSGPVPGWDNPRNHLVWYVKFRKPGDIVAAIHFHSSKPLKQSVRLEVSDTNGRIGNGTSQIREGGDNYVDLGDFKVRKAGYMRFVLSSPAPITDIKVEGLKLTGEPVTDALINETRWRSSASVHLRWPTEKDAPVTWFYNEILPKTSPLTTYYMACGWSRGYFGIQVNSPTERRVIFSVWDSGTEKVSRDKVDKTLQVQLMDKGKGVFTGSFGNEGTGGHSHLVYPWKTGQGQRFLVRSEPKGDHTIYSGYYYFNDTKKWGLISSWSAPQDGHYLKSLYSFIEDFWGGEGQKQRVADFGPAWVRTGDVWSQVTAGSFTHTARMPNYRDDYYFKVNGTRVTASSGGYTDEGPTTYGARFSGVKPSKPVSQDVLDLIKKEEAKGKN